ncbi:MAG: hypothetical protein IT537_13515 [Hyphomicrobiales bacterium]|nr:hypothetical protein [Hyphomicrobiales bacterium]
MLPDFRFVLGAIMAIALLGVSGLGLVTTARLSHQAKMGPLETARNAFDDRADWNQFYDPESLRRFIGLSDRGAPTEAEQQVAPPPTAPEVPSTATAERAGEPTDIAPARAATSEARARAPEDVAEPSAEATATPARDATLGPAPLAPEPPPMTAEAPAEPAAASTPATPAAPTVPPVAAEPLAPSPTLPSEAGGRHVGDSILTPPARSASDSQPPPYNAGMIDPPPTVLPRESVLQHVDTPTAGPTGENHVTGSSNPDTAPPRAAEGEEVATTATLSSDPPLPVAKPRTSAAKPRTARPQRTVARRAPLQPNGAAFTYGQPPYQQQMFPRQQLAPRPAPQPAYTRSPQYRTDGFGQGWRFGG